MSTVKFAAAVLAISLCTMGSVQAQKPAADKDIVFTKTEVEPSFPGGLKGWRSFLEHNLNAATPVDHGAGVGTYVVMVQFIVDADGQVHDIKALTNHGFGMEEEVVRLMKSSPKWIPATQNGRQVNAYQKQPVTFVISNG